MSSLTVLTTNISLATKMYMVKAAVYQLLGGKLKTRDLKKLAIRKGWVATGAGRDFRRKQTWIDVYSALVRERSMAALAAAA